METIKAIGLAILVFLAGCQSLAELRIFQGVERIAAGTNGVGEDCWAESGTMVFAEFEEVDRLFNIYCGDWEWPSARIFRIPSDQFDPTQWNAVPETWEGRLQSQWHDILGTRMRCEERHSTTIILDRVEAILLTCKLLNGSWPYIALVTHVRGSTYLADGIPAALPFIEQTVAVLGGRKVNTEKESAAVRYMKTAFGRRLYRASHLQAYYQAMTLGQYYNGTKAFAKAERQYRRALRIHQSALENPSEIQDERMHLALELSNQEKFDQAEKIFDELESSITEKLDEEDYSRLLSYRALHDANQRKFERALGQAKRVTDRLKPRTNTTKSDHENTSLAAAQFLPNNSNLAHSLYIEAAMHERLGSPDEGIQKLKDAEFVLETRNNVPPLWKPQLNRLEGMLDIRNQEFEKAGSTRRKAAKLYQERAPGERPTMLSYLELGNSLAHENKIDEALDNFREAIGIAKSKFTKFRHGELVPFFEILLQRAHSHPAESETIYREMFEAAQLVQSGVTANDIARTVARFAKADNRVGRLLSEFQQLEYERVQKEKEFDIEFGHVLEQDHDQRLKQIRQELVTIDQRLSENAEQIQQFSPKYKQVLGYPVSADDVFSALHRREVLVQILVDRAKSFVFVLDSGGVIAYSVDISSAELARMVDQLRKQVDSQNRGVGLAGTITQAAKPTVQAYDISLSYALYRKLFAPVSEKLLQASHVITVASGPLLSLPLSLLVTQEPQQYRLPRNNYSKVPWLIQQTSISLVPSAQSFVYLRKLKRPSDSEKTIIAFGDFIPNRSVMESREKSAKSVCEEDGYNNLRALPGTRKEVIEVVKNFPESQTRLVLNSEFREKVIKAIPLQDYRIVYFATHALLPDEIECLHEPSLVTSRDHLDHGENGLLTLKEIEAMHLNADLVVLSACNTGAADRAGGESLSGLARGFFFAGGRALLATHWYINDPATASLMSRMFQLIRDRKVNSLAGALRKAQTEMINNLEHPEWSHPGFWASFSLIGDGERGLLGI